MTRVRKGDPSARNRLIEANLKFVVGVSRNYQHQGLPLCDIINEGNLGLIRAIIHFDETKHFKFISYAVWWIRQAILTALSEHSRIVRVPINRISIIYNAGKTADVLEQKLQRTPMVFEIAQELGLKEQTVNDTLSIGNTHTSLNAPAGENNSTSLIDLLQDRNQILPDKGILDFSFRREVEIVLEQLPEREKEIIKLYFGIGEKAPSTLDKIAKRYNLTRERIRQIKEKAIIRLRKIKLLEHLDK